MSQGNMANKIKSLAIKINNYNQKGNQVSEEEERILAN